MSIMELNVNDMQIHEITLELEIAWCHVFFPNTDTVTKT